MEAMKKLLHPNGSGEELYPNTNANLDSNPNLTMIMTRRLALTLEQPDRIFGGLVPLVPCGDRYGGLGVNYIL